MKAAAAFKPHKSETYIITMQADLGSKEGISGQRIPQQLANACSADRGGVGAYRGRPLPTSGY